MAVETFQNRVDALTGFGTTDNSALADWLTDGAREVISLLPPELKLKCVKETIIDTAQGLNNFDTRGMILGVTRFDGTRYQPCREIPGVLRGRVSDSSDLMSYGTASDPVFWKWNNVLGAYPDGTISVQHIFFPVFDITGTGDNIQVDGVGDTSISNNFNFPDEVEHIVVLYAAIKAAQSLLASEEDDDLYVPIINTLKTDYMTSLQALGVNLAPKTKTQGKGKNKQMEELLEQIQIKQG